MKKLVLVVAIAAFISACNDVKKTESTVTSIDSSKLMGSTADTSSKMMDSKMADTTRMMDKMADTTKMK